MVLQFEDCVDVIAVLFLDYHLLANFDRSCGHDRQRPDGLSIPKLSKYYGGSQPKMRESFLETDDHLGPFPGQLKKGDTQKMIFSDNDTGPFYLTTTNRKKRRGGVINQRESFRFSGNVASSIPPTTSPPNTTQ